MNKVRNLSNPIKFVIMIFMALILTINGWSYNGTPLMIVGLICFLVALYCYYVAFKLLKEMIK